MTYTLLEEPAVEENVPAVDDQSNNPAVEENLPAADELTKDSNGGSTPRKGEVLPSESLPEVDTEQTVTDEAEPLAGKEDGPESLEHKVDDLVGLVQEQDKQLVLLLHESHKIIHLMLQGFRTIFFSSQRLCLICYSLLGVDFRQAFRRQYPKP